MANSGNRGSVAAVAAMGLENTMVVAAGRRPELPIGAGADSRRTSCLDAAALRECDAQSKVARDDTTTTSS